MEHTQVADTWERGNPYEYYVGRWSRQVAPLFLSWMQVPRGERWVDVGCGTGALAAAIFEHCAPASVVGIEPSQGFLDTARDRLPAQTVLKRGTATDIPLGDDSVDVTVSGLVLNFVEDTNAALAEMARVTRGGGAVGAYVWDYAGKMQLMRFFWDAAVELDPNAANIDEGVRFPLCRREALKASFEGAGLGAVEVTAIDIATRFEDFDDYWRPFLGGQGPAPAYAMSLDTSARACLRDRIRERLPAAADGVIELTARAWAARGIVASQEFCRT